MRLFHYALIPVLDNKHLVAQWRECIAIKRQWEKGTLKHRLVSYVMNYDKIYFMGYVISLIEEMRKRKINYNKIYYKEILDFCEGFTTANYPEHNDRYLRQCLYNLEEKAMRNIISKDEWLKIYNKFKDFTDLWDGEIISQEEWDKIKNINNTIKLTEVI